MAGQLFEFNITAEGFVAEADGTVISSTDPQENQ